MSTTPSNFIKTLVSLAAAPDRPVGFYTCCFARGKLGVGDAAAGLPFAFSNWLDHVVTTLRGHRLGRLHCRTIAEWTKVLQPIGFAVDAKAKSQGTPFANACWWRVCPPPTDLDIHLF